MFMEPHAADRHPIEPVVRNFGKRTAEDVRFEFTDASRVAVWEPDEPTDVRMPRIDPGRDADCEPVRGRRGSAQV